MDFDYTPEQHAIRELAARVFADRMTDDFMRTFSRSGEGFDRTLWATLAETGLLGIAVPAEHGGAGAGLIECCLVLEELGRTLAPVPLFSTMILGALPIAAFGRPDQQSGLLPRVARGEILLTAAMGKGVTAKANGKSWRLTGEESCVPYASDAHRILVSASQKTFLVDPKARGVSLESQRSTSGEPQSRITLNAVEADLLGSGHDIESWLFKRRSVALASMQLGVGAEALRRTTEYVNQRVQFGRPLGSFQSVQHRVADGYIALESLRSVYMKAVGLLEAGLPAKAESAAVAWWISSAGEKAANIAMYLHGGLGADTDYPIHRFFQHAKQIELAAGGAAPALWSLGEQIAAGAVQPFT